MYPTIKPAVDLTAEYILILVFLFGRHILQMLSASESEGFQISRIVNRISNLLFNMKFCAGLFWCIFYSAIFCWLWWIALTPIQQESLLSERNDGSFSRHAKIWFSYITPTYSHNLNTQVKVLSVLDVSAIISPTSGSITQKGTTE
jgi:hypothetical protein